IERDGHVVVGEHPDLGDLARAHPFVHRADERAAHAVTAAGGADADLVEQQLRRLGALADDLTGEEADHGVGLLRDPHEHVAVREEGARLGLGERRTRLAAPLDVEVGLITRDQIEHLFVAELEPADDHRGRRTRNERRWARACAAAASNMSLSRFILVRSIPPCMTAMQKSASASGRADGTSSPAALRSAKKRASRPRLHARNSRRSPRSSSASSVTSAPMVPMGHERAQPTDSWNEMY